MTFLKNTNKSIYFAIWGTLGGGIGSLISEMARLNEPASFMVRVLRVGGWFGIIGAIITLALLLAQSSYFGRGLRFEKPTIHGCGFGLVSGIVAGGIAQAIYGAYGSHPPEYLRIFCWGIAGGLLGLSLSFRIPNLKAIRGAGGGFVGGLVGGLLFVLCSLVFHEVLGRLAGVASIGAAIGLMLILAEALFREAWLEIQYGPREKRTVSLGKEPVRIGSDPGRCTIYTPDVPPVACAYVVEQGRIFHEDGISGKKTAVSPGDSRRVGRLTIVVQGSGSPAAEKTSQPLHAEPLPSPGAGLSLRFSSGDAYALTLEKKLTAEEISGLEPQSSEGVVAEVNCNPNNPAVLGLRNLSRQTWSVSMPDGARRVIEPGRSVRLADGVMINFGFEIGQVRES